MAAFFIAPPSDYTQASSDFGGSKPMTIGISRGFRGAPLGAFAGMTGLMGQSLCCLIRGRGRPAMLARKYAERESGLTRQKLW